MIRSSCIGWLLGLVFLCVSYTAYAHKPSDSYLKIKGSGEILTLQWDIALKDLEMLIGLDENQDRKITWGELKVRQDAIAAHALGKIKISAEGQKGKLVLDDLLYTRHSDGGYAVLVIGTDLPGDSANYRIEYDFLFKADPTHRGLVIYENDGAVSTHILSPESPELDLVTGQTSHWQSFLSFVWEGIWHIWIGFDHLLFLVSLLLPAVLIRERKSWQPTVSFWPACKEVLKIVTVFTVAHSITLWLAAMEYVTLSSQLVEASIALSIIVVAINNIYPVLPFKGWLIAFIFGLIHGFGFANVLLDLGLSSAALALSLFGFNLGVELGQLAVVLLIFPLFYFARKQKFYYRGVLQGGSVLIGLLALIWFCERAFNLEIIGF